MRAGKIFEVEIYEIRTHLEADRVVDGMGVAANGIMESHWTPAKDIFARGIYLACRTVQAGGPILESKHEYRLHIPALGYDVRLIYDGWQSPMDTKLEIDGLKVYVEANPDPVFVVKWNEMRWYVEGVLQDTIPGNELVSSLFTPAGIPLIGVPPRAFCNAGVDTLLTI